jgi:dienelactone hydrolase
MKVLGSILAPLFMLLFAAAAGLATARAEETRAAAAGEVRFPSAPTPPTALQLRLAKKRGEPAPEARPEIELSARLTRPRGAGPFPAVVLLHGCAGRKAAQDDWAARLADWGYVALQIDSFGPRGLRAVCDSQAGPNVGGQVFDAFGGLLWLRRQSLIGRRRIAVMGWGQGATAALDSVLSIGSASFFDRGFAAALAVSPYCPGNIPRRYLAPVLILTGAKDDLMPAARCRRIAARPETGGEAITLVVYPDAHYGFDDPAQGAAHSVPDVLNIERSPPRGATFGYNAAAHRGALAQVRMFLAQEMQ